MGWVEKNWGCFKINLRICTVEGDGARGCPEQLRGSSEKMFEIVSRHEGGVGKFVEKLGSSKIVRIFK